MWEVPEEKVIEKSLQNYYSLFKVETMKYVCIKIQ